jgi:hypothetical protein
MSKETTPETRHAELDSASPSQSLDSEETLKQVQGDSTPETPRWIPFSERPPEHGQWYARMYVHQDGLKELQTSAQFWHKDGLWAFNSYDGYRGKTMEMTDIPNMIYWFPLPKEQELKPYGY